MRVPPLFVIDEILKMQMGLSSSAIQQTVVENLTIVTNAENFTQENATHDALSGMDEDIEFYKVISITTIKFFMCLLGNFSFFLYFG